MTIATELTDQLSTPPSVVVVPVGVGSLAQAMTQSLGPGSATNARIVTAEPEAAPCLHTSLANGKLTTVETRFTVMPGLNCGSVSPQAWPYLKAGIQPEDAIVVSDEETTAAVKHLGIMRVAAGPCGAASLAAARKIKLKEEDTVVLICTEGRPEREEENTELRGVLKDGGVIKQPLKKPATALPPPPPPERGGAVADTPFGKLLWG